MSLNRCEQRVSDYLLTHPEEKRFWQGKVQKLSAPNSDPHAVATRLEAELWHYYKERSEIVPAFREAVRHEGLQRTSMRSLAEYLLQLWIPVSRSKKNPTSHSSM
ncbi:MAG: hypothetical protein JWM88_731 [Verrucomicrobia bacterium]|nr:hypothetical protein [Verrucomicrobiota bacterium]